MKRPSLLSQILALNLLMVTAGIFVASIAAGLLWSHVSPRAPFFVGAGAAAAGLLAIAVTVRAERAVAR